MMFLEKNSRRYSFVLWLLSTVLLFGCGSGVKTENGLVTIDIAKSYPEKELILQDLFDIEYLPLETTDEFVTAGNVAYVGDDCIWLGSYRTGDFQLLNREGKYIRTINRKGQSGEEYLFYSGMTFDPLAKELYVSDSRKVVVFDEEGNFKRSFQTPLQDDSYIYWMNDFNPEYLLCYMESRVPVNTEEQEQINVSALGFILVSKKDGSIRKINIPFERYASPNIVFEETYTSILNYTQIPFQDQWILTEISSDTTYLLSQDYQLKPFIVRTPTAPEMNPEVYLYAGVMTDRYYFLQTVDKAYNRETKVGFETREILYDKEEKAVYEYVVYNNDFTDERPLNLVRQFPNTLLPVNKGDVAYVSKIDAPDLVDAYKEGKLREGSRLEEIASTLDEEDNPVILIAKYKK